MAARLRNLAAAKVRHAAHNVNREFEASNRAVAAQLRLHSDKKEKVQLRLPLPSLGFASAEMSEFVQQFPLEDDGITGLDWAGEQGLLQIHLDRHAFIEQVVLGTLLRPPDYSWCRHALFPENPGHVVIEFSSPNIAKPFHAGHLRSTILGNFVANIHEAVGHPVTRLCYLGDWGTQFGLLLAGLEDRGAVVTSLDPDPATAANTVQFLLKVYVEATTRAKQEPEFAAKAQRAFRELENGDEEKLKLWEFCRKVSLSELIKSYSKLNVKFDHFHGESMYKKDESEDVMEMLERSGMLRTLEDGRRVVEVGEGRTVTVTKSDGTSLYISRDIAAAIHRKQSFQFDQMIYVVDNSQEIHFKNLFVILAGLGLEWSKDCRQVGFGKILGMSTRRGQVLLLSDLVEEASRRGVEQQKSSSNTRVSGVEAAAVAEQVGLTALVVQDLQHRRRKNYQFSWERAVGGAGDGPRLQYCHSRLSSLLAQAEAGGVATDYHALAARPCCGLLLGQPAALDLALALARYEESLALAYSNLEPGKLVRGLLGLAGATGRALPCLPVLAAPDEDTATARLQLFAAARKTLAEGLQLLGITPLHKM